MTPPGRKPKPRAIRLLEGNPGKRPLPAPGPIKEGRVPACPADLTAEQKRIWRRTVDEIRSLLMPGDREVLAMFCVAVDHAHRAARLVGEAGLLVRGQRGSEVVKNPAESMARANARLVTTLAAELGLTPTSRARIIQGVAQIDDPYDDAARLLS